MTDIMDLIFNPCVPRHDFQRSLSLVVAAPKHEEDPPVVKAKVCKNCGIVVVIEEDR